MKSDKNICDVFHNAGTALSYSANALNQYSAITATQGVTAQSASSSEATGVSLLPFSPEYDADGNMTLIQTSTGTWSVSYNAENRPVTWTNSAGEKICMIYDSRGRRAEKRVFNAAGTRTLRERYVYAGYTCVQVLDGDDGNAVVKEFAWDPTEPVATKPLFMFLPQARLSLLYTHDGNKNVADACYLAPQNGVGAHYEYAPFGALTRVSKNTRVTVPDVISANPFRFSSEYFDDELGLVYYNFRHYSPDLGRFLSRDHIEENGGWNLYAYVRNQAVTETDILGKVCCVIIAHPGNYPGDQNSSAGHAILDCGDDGYLSFFPQKADGNKVGIGTFPGINHDREKDEEQYGISDELWGSDNVIIHPEGGRLTRQCLPDCVDSGRAQQVITDLLANTPNWDFNDSNCADMVMEALSRLIVQEKPKCGPCETVDDILQKHSEIRMPDGVEADIAALVKNGCKRYRCVFDPLGALFS